MKLMSYLLAIIAMISLASCSKNSNIPVPADAGMVLHINGKSLHSRLSWDEFKQGELYKIASREADNELAKKILDNPDSSGIDIKSDAFLFITSRGNGGYVGFTCAVKDEKAFRRFIESTDGQKEIIKEGEISLIKTRSTVLTWSSKRVVMIADNPGLNAGGGFGAKRYNGGFPEDSLVRFAKEVYTIKGSSSIGSNKKFSAMMNEDGDAHIWLNPGKLYSGSFSAVLPFTKANVLTEGNFTTATLNFDKGKITVDAKSYYNKEMGELYKKYDLKNLDVDMLKKIPSGKVAAAMAMNYPPQALKDLLVLLGVDGLANQYLGQAGISIDDFVKANKGDILFAVSDFGIAEKEMKIPMGDGRDFTYKTKAPEAKFLFATSVNDKPSFDKLITALTNKISEGGEKFKTAAGRIPYVLTDQWFVAGNDSLSVHAYGATVTDHAFISKISGHPMGGYIDIQQFINGSRGSLDTASAFVFDESLRFWEDVVFYGGERKNDAAESHFEINLKDKNTNSLKQLNNYLGIMVGKIVAERDRQKADMSREWGEDGPATVVPVVPDTDIRTVPKLRR